MRKKNKKILTKVLLGVTALIGSILFFNNTKKKETKKKKETIISKNNDGDLFI